MLAPDNRSLLAPGKHACTADTRFITILAYVTVSGCMGTKRSERTWFHPDRRSVMKAVGAGTALGVLSGTTTAAEHDENDDSNYVEENDVDEAPSGNTVHVVRTLITESTHPERPADFFYQPTGLHVEPGDVIQFVFETPDHTVTSYHPAYGMQRRIPPSVQPFSSPILGWDPHSLPDDVEMPPEENGQHDDASPKPDVWLQLFETPGVYDIECAPHEAFGMAMRVVVGDETETVFETDDPGALPPPRAGPVGLAREVLTDPNLSPEAIVEEGSVEWMDLAANQPSESNNETTEE